MLESAPRGQTHSARQLGRPIWTKKNATHDGGEHRRHTGSEDSTRRGRDDSSLYIHASSQVIEDEGRGILVKRPPRVVAI